MPDQTKEERQYVLIVTASVRELNLEMTRVILSETVTAFRQEDWPLRTPKWQQFFLASLRAKKVQCDTPGATIEEVTGEGTGDRSYSIKHHWTSQ